MHELPVTRSIHQIVLRHAAAADASRVLTVNLEIGALSDLQEEWVQRYFDRLSRGTVAAGAKLRIDRVPAVFRCRECLRSFHVDSVMAGVSCPHCESTAVTLASRRMYHVKDMEVV